MITKREIRIKMKARRKELPPEKARSAAEVICRKTISRAQGGVVAVYLAAQDEIDLSAAIEELLKRGIIVVAPRWNGQTYELARIVSLRAKDLRLGPMGILEPNKADIVEPKEVTTWLIPGLAFTLEGARLGYGGGWYDRLLLGANEEAEKIGLAYSFQIVENLPSEAHDIRVNKIITESI